MDVAVIGEALIDFTPQGNNAAGFPVFAQNPGGAPANVACAITKLGGSCTLFTKLSTDPFGRFLATTLERAGVDMRGVRISEDPTGLAYVTIDEKGERDFVFYRNNCADAMFTTTDLDLKLIDACKVFHFSSVSLTSPLSRKSTIFAVEYARKRGKIISFDINHRPLLWADEAEGRHIIRQLIPLANILKASEDEALIFSGERDPEKAAAYFENVGCILSVMTMGSKGCLYRLGGEAVTVPSYPVKVTDSTGAGDAFMGALLHHLCGYIHDPETLKNTPAKQLVQAMQYANAAGAVCTTRYGAIPALANEADIAAIMSSDNFR